MPGKDDPLESKTHYDARSGQTLWLEADTMNAARDNYWQAYHRLNPTGVGNLDDRHTWDVAWAAAIAAFTYVQQGRTRPS